MPRSVRTRSLRRPPSLGDSPSYERLASLLNAGIRAASGAWIAFLDDDNVFEVEHVSSLVACASASGARAVHSGRTMLWRDGSPYLLPLFPHAQNEEDARRIYELLCARGIWIRGTNVLMDRADGKPGSGRNSTVMLEEDPVFLVDQNVWLIQRDLLLASPIPEEFSATESANGTAPDDKLLEVLLDQHVEIARTHLATVRYFVGGMSNAHNAGAPA